MKNLFVLAILAGLLTFISCSRKKEKASSSSDTTNIEEPSNTSNTDSMITPIDSSATTSSRGIGTIKHDLH